MRILLDHKSNILQTFNYSFKKTKYFFLLHFQQQLLQLRCILYILVTFQIFLIFYIKEMRKRKDEELKISLKKEKKNNNVICSE